MKIIGPFAQIITLDNLNLKGAIKDNALQIIEHGAILVENGKICLVDIFEKLVKQHPKAEIKEIDAKTILLPGFVDCHTHSCFAGTRAMDFAERNAGTSYLEIAEKGGGIWSTVLQTRATEYAHLKELTENRINNFLNSGITTIEIKSGYGLSIEHEIRMLEIINSLNTKATIIPTCLAAHVKPRDFAGSHTEYLNYISNELLPKIKTLCQRVDIFTEQSAFTIADSEKYLKHAQSMGFEITVHADQFNSGSGVMAAQLNALSADHLEATSDHDIQILAQSNTVAVALPGASLGLGEPFTPARKLLDAGACLAIASDYNPGSAPMGDLLTQASILACYEKLSTAEILSGLTFRAAKALNINNLGKIKPEFQADLQAYDTEDYREILYHQGKLKPSMVWKNGLNIKTMV